MLSLDNECVPAKRIRLDEDKTEIVDLARPKTADTKRPWYISTIELEELILAKCIDNVQLVDQHYSHGTTISPIKWQTTSPTVCV